MESNASSGQQPVPLEWRPTLSRVVAAFAEGDYRLDPGIPGVESPSASSAMRIARYVQDHGATLVPLPEESWDTSVCAWNGCQWEVLVDLWTQEVGCSDLVMHAVVLPSGCIRIDGVYVP